MGVKIYFYQIQNFIYTVKQFQLLLKWGFVFTMDNQTHQLIFNLQEGFFCLGMVPVVDGPGGFLPDTPSNIRLSKNYTMVPEIITHTAEDGMIYMVACRLSEFV